MSSKLSASAKVLITTYAVSLIGWLTTAVSLFMFIWCPWQLALRVGITGLVTYVITFVTWYWQYNIYCATKKAIENGKKKNV